MDILNWKNTLVIGGPVLCGLAFKLIKNRIYKNKDDALINQVLFYGPEFGLSNMLFLTYVVSHANETVDVCVPSLTSEMLTRCLIKLHKGNEAKVRVIIHNGDRFDNQQILQSFAQHDIEVKVIKSVVRLEHEFILMDAEGAEWSEVPTETLAIIGPLDYDPDGVCCHWNNSMLVSEPALILNLQREFDRLWNATP